MTGSREAWEKHILEMEKRLGMHRPTPAEKAEIAAEWNGNIEQVTIKGGAVVRKATDADEHGRRGSTPPPSAAAVTGAAKAVSREASQTQVAAAAPLYPLVGLCRATGLAEPVPEYMFAKKLGRKWRFDYAFLLSKIAVEVEGGVWTQGRHTRGSGFIEDMRKYNAAAVLGWRVLRYQPDSLQNAIGDLLAIFRDDNEAA